MRHLITILASLAVLAAPAHAQTVKALSYNTNGNVIYGGTNQLRFTNEVAFGPANGDVTTITDQGFSFLSTNTNTSTTVFTFEDAGAEKLRQNARGNLGLGATWLTNTNATNFRTAIGLGATNTVTFGRIETDAFMSQSNVTEFYKPMWIGDSGTNDIFQFEIGSADQAKARTNLGLGQTNIVTFAGLTNNGDITINQTATNNGLLYIRRTNNESFLGLANLIASNNTTVSNETLFRVGVQEATNKAAQFGFRSTNTNGSGVAVFSVFGFNALMQIGADASTNAVIYSGGSTNNEVMTLIRDGATEFARPLRFSTNASTRPATNAPANTTNVAAWIEMRIGTNSYRVQLFQ